MWRSLKPPHFWRLALPSFSFSRCPSHHPPKPLRRPLAGVRLCPRCLLMPLHAAGRLGAQKSAFGANRMPGHPGDISQQNLLLAIRCHRLYASDRSKPMLALGLKNLSVRRLKCCRKALLDHMVGEVLAYVQGESLKANAALLTEAS